MNLLVVGAGRVGMRLVQAMEHLGHDVAVVEENPAFIERLAEMTPPFHGAAVRGVPIDVDVLRSAGIEMCDAVAAVTQDDNINVMVAQMAKEVFHVNSVIARVTDPVAKEVFSERFGLRTVCGTNLTAQAFVAGLLHSVSVDDEKTETRMSIGSSTAEFTAVLVAEAQIGSALHSIAPPAQGTMVFGVMRASGVMELAANPDVVLRQGDSIVYVQLAD
ncbi:MAG: TrkA family potassium uptake protein [Ruthenibacterium sp.]